MYCSDNYGKRNYFLSTVRSQSLPENFVIKDRLTEKDILTFLSHICMVDTQENISRFHYGLKFRIKFHLNGESRRRASRRRKDIDFLEMNIFYLRDTLEEI